MKLVITIPAYNEEKTIGKVLEDIKEVMNKTKYNYRLLVVDDGSKDKTAEIAKKAGAKVYSHPYNLGLAEAFRTELQQCLEMGADIIVHTDADGQYNAKDIPKLIKEVENGYDLVLGNRFAGGLEKMPLIKKLGNKIFSWAISKIIKYKVQDCQTGFRAFNKCVAKINIISKHTYTQEQIIRVIKNKMKIKEIPTYFYARNGKSRLISNPFEYAIKAWINILRIYRDFEPLKFFGKIGSFLFGLGVILGCYFIYLHLTSGIVGHMGLLMLMLLLVFTGLQIILFGFLADMKIN